MTTTDEAYYTVLKQLTIPDIKHILRAHGICEYGLRSQLVTRIEQLLLSTIADNNDEDEVGRSLQGEGCQAKEKVHTEPSFKEKAHQNEMAAKLQMSLNFITNNLRRHELHHADYLMDSVVLNSTQSLPLVVSHIALPRKRCFTDQQETPIATYQKVITKLGIAVDGTLTPLESCSSLRFVRSVYLPHVKKCEAELSCAAVDSCTVKKDKISRIRWKWSSHLVKSQARRPKRIHDEITPTDNDESISKPAATHTLTAAAAEFLAKLQKTSIDSSPPSLPSTSPPPADTPDQCERRTQVPGHYYSHIDLDSIQLPDEPAETTSLKVTQGHSDVDNYSDADVYGVKGHTQDDDGHHYSHVDLDSIQLPDEPAETTSLKVAQGHSDVDNCSDTDGYGVKGHAQDDDGHYYSHVDLDSIQLPDEPAETTSLKVTQGHSDVNNCFDTDVYEVKGHTQDDDGSYRWNGSTDDDLPPPKPALLPTPPDGQLYGSPLPPDLTFTFSSASSHPTLTPPPAPFYKTSTTPSTHLSYPNLTPSPTFPSHPTLNPPPAPYPLFVASEQWAASAARQGQGYVWYVAADQTSRSSHRPSPLYRAAGYDSWYSTN